MMRSLFAARKVVATQPIRSMASLSLHKNSSYNNADTPFEFTAESMTKIEGILKKFPPNYKQSAVMPLMFIAQEQNDNWLPIAAMNKIAEMLDMPPMRVYEVATFFTMYNREPVGKFHLQICGTSTCMCMGALDIKKAAMEFAGTTHSGEVSKDGNWCISEVECLGACTNAPMFQLNNKLYYENLTPESTIKIMEGLLAGNPPPHGPQNGQRVAEGPMGIKTLVGYEAHYPKFRDIDQLLADKKAADEKAKADKAAADAAAAAEKK